MNAWLALALGYPGFALLAAAMERHGDDMLGRALDRGQRHAVQAGGSVLLAVALAVCVGAWGATVGTAVWLGVLSICALSLGALLTYAPRLAVRLAWVLAPCGVLAALLPLVRG